MKEIKLSELLTDKQKVAWRYLKDDHTTFVLYGGAAGGGKSFAGCVWLFVMAARYPATRWVMGRSVLKRLKETTLKTFFEVLEMFGYTSYKFNHSDGVIYLHNGSEIILKDLFRYPSDPHFLSLGSLEITGCFIDECNQVTQLAKDILFSRIRYKLDNFGLAPKMFASCNPSKGWVYNEIYKPHRDGTLAPTKQFIPALLDDNKHIASTYRASLESMNDKIAVQRLRYGNWEYDDSGLGLFEYDALVDIFSNQVDDTGAYYITCDIARLGKDKTVVVVWKGLQAVEIKSYDKTLIPEVVKLLAAAQKEYRVRKSNIIVDEDGVGGGAKDMFLCRGFVNGSKALAGNYTNLKAECYYKLAKVVSEGRLSIQPSAQQEMIIEELEAVEAVNVDKDGKLAICGKDKIKEKIGRSPDFGDAIMMRMWWEVKPKMKAIVKAIKN